MDTLALVLFVIAFIAGIVAFIRSGGDVLGYALPLAVVCLAVADFIVHVLK